MWFSPPGCSLNVVFVLLGEIGRQSTGASKTGNLRQDVIRPLAVEHHLHGRIGTDTRWHGFVKNDSLTVKMSIDNGHLVSPFAQAQPSMPGLINPIARTRRLLQYDYYTTNGVRFYMGEDQGHRRARDRQGLGYEG